MSARRGYSAYYVESTELCAQTLLSARGTRRSLSEASAQQRHLALTPLEFDVCGTDLLLFINVLHRASLWKGKSFIVALDHWHSRNFSEMS